ncbi:uncharacterized protein LOC110117610 isoform X1 [Ceratitis capitata]|uniref:uncharacterized protein LOC110117610 isoform X1 n=1 Tax=Ceratitis capitata TaxID=7213 RepID=UPI000A118681|nr:uncharacterized protein LOC110117610 isoform X1 [Ceratitis capitata]
MVSFMNRQIDADVQVGEHPEGKQQAENHKRVNKQTKKARLQHAMYFCFHESSLWSHMFAMIIFAYANASLPDRKSSYTNTIQVVGRCSSGCIYHFDFHSLTNPTNLL